MSLNDVIPNSRRNFMKVFSLSGFVKISASWFSVFTNSNDTIPFSTLSRKKWCLISICLVLEWLIGFFERLMALVLSQYIVELFENSNPFN